MAPVPAADDVSRGTQRCRGPRPRKSLRGFESLAAAAAELRVRRSRPEGVFVAEAVLIRPAVMSDVPGLCRLAELLARQHAAYDPARYRLPTSVADAYADLLS